MILVKSNKMEKTLKPEKLINCGQDGCVWLFEDMAIKIPHKNSKLAERELETAVNLYANNISVPRPRGLFKISLFEKTYIGFGMDYIANSVPAYMSSEAKELMLKEIKKVNQLGYKTRDTEWMQNCLWAPKQNKIYLIDFVGWKRK